MDGNLKKSKRKFLLYIPVNKGQLLADIFGQDREYDIALHDFAGDIYCGNPIAEYKFAGRGHKWFCIKNNLPRINKEYQYYAFFDNDIVNSICKCNS